MGARRLGVSPARTRCADVRSRAGWDTGRFFYSLDAQGVCSAIGARVLHHLPYFYARMSLSDTAEGIHYRSRRRHPGHGRAVPGHLSADGDDDPA
ncbi:MAG: DUF2071 domain-containing protein [Natrialbaceae archaeon]|nr:DUF2071 domain-containing protein [Natrialbaceae archaeon]